VGKGLTAAQRRAVTGSEPSTGRLTARPEVCAGLVAAGLAVRHGRVGQHYLTPEGRRVRAELAARTAPDEAVGAGRTGGADRSVGPDGPGGTAPSGAAAGSGPGIGAARPAPSAGQFVADDGSGTVAVTPGRAAEVAAAWEGLLQIRSVLADGSVLAPAGWERERPVHAVALALEAAGVPPAHGERSPGYRVGSSDHPGLIEVTWSDPGSAPAALARIATVLAPLGWQATEHHARTGAAFLLVSPRYA
jgi:hypothetical protein